MSSEMFDPQALLLAGVHINPQVILLGLAIFIQGIILHYWAFSSKLVIKR